MFPGYSLLILSTKSFFSSTIIALTLCIILHYHIYPIFNFVVFNSTCDNEVELNLFYIFAAENIWTVSHQSCWDITLLSILLGWLHSGLIKTLYQQPSSLVLTKNWESEPLPNFSAITFFLNPKGPFQPQLILKSLFNFDTNFNGRDKVVLY